MTRISLPRSGDAPLEFDGVLLDESKQAPAHATRHHRVAVYRLGGGRFVCEVELSSKWEAGYRTARLCGGRDEAAEFFREYDPLSRFVGPPPGHPKRRLIEREVVSQYEAAVSDVLSALPEIITITTQQQS